MHRFRLRSLIACNDPTVDADVSKALATYGYQIDHAHSRADAIRSFLTHRQPIVILQASFLPRFPFRLLQLFKMAHCSPSVVILAKKDEHVLGYTFLRDGIFDLIRLPIDREALSFALWRAHWFARVQARSQFLWDILVQAALAVPILMLLVYLMARHR